MYSQSTINHFHIILSAAVAVVVVGSIIIPTVVGLAYWLTREPAPRPKPVRAPAPAPETSEARMPAGLAAHS